jgi:glycosidase
VQDRSFTISDKEFFKLIEKLHNAGIKVILDMSLLYGSANSYLVEDIARNGNKSQYYNRF